MSGWWSFSETDCASGWSDYSRERLVCARLGAMAAHAKGLGD
jgi:hypothetical protein